MKADYLRLLPMNWFENWFGSPFYKILYQNRDEQEAQEFVENLLDYLKPPCGCDMLDIACGEGRFAKQLAEHDFDVVGIDISHPAIEIAKAYEDDKLHFYVQDMRFPFYINYFDFAFNFFTSFGYFKHNRDHKLAAKSFAAALKQDGILVIDYLNYEYVKQHMKAEQTIQRGSYTFMVKKSIVRKHIIKHISFTDADKKHREFTESVAGFTLADFVSMFEEAGMALMSTFGDYKLNTYKEAESPRMIMIFKKK